MKKLFILVVIALIVSVLTAGIKKTVWTQYDIIVLEPDSLVSIRADAMVWGHFYIIKSDSSDTASMTPDMFIVDSITVTDYLHSTDDVQFDSTLRFGSGAVISNPHADTLTITEGNIDFVGKLKVGSFGSPLDVTSNRKYGLELHYYGNNYDVFGLRSRAQLKTTDAPTRTVCGAEIQASNNDGINASVINGAIIEAIGKSSSAGARIGTMRGLIVGAEWGAYDTVTNLKTLHIRTHTRDATGDGCFDGTGYGLYIENVAVGGNGQALDAGIYLDGTNLSAGNKAFIYGADFSGVATDIGTADFRFRSGGLIDNPVDTFRITEAKLDLIGDALLDDVTIDSALTVEGKAVFNDTVMLGDSIDKIILPKGSSIELFDSTDTDKFQIYDTGAHSVFASVNPFTMNNGLWLLGDTLFFTDGGADTNYIENTGTYFKFAGDNNIIFGIIAVAQYDFQLWDDLVGTYDAKEIRWDGEGWYIDYDNDAALAFISFHAEDSIKVDTTGATGHRLSWTGAGGMEIRDGSGADSARWYDDGTHTTFTTDNDFVLSDDVTLGDTINTILLPKATKLMFTDSSGADTTTMFNDGTKLSISSDNQIQFGGENVYILAGDTLFISSATFTEFSLYVSGDALYVHGTGADEIHLECGDIYVDGNLHANVMVATVCDTVASATTVTLGNYNNFVITGVSAIDSIDTAGTMPNWGIAYIEFSGTAVGTGLTDGRNLKIAGNFGYTPDDMIILQRRGNIFYELSRSAN